GNIVSWARIPGECHGVQCRGETHECNQTDDTRIHEEGWWPVSNHHPTLTAQTSAPILGKFPGGTRSVLVEDSDCEAQRPAAATDSSLRFPGKAVLLQPEDAFLGPGMAFAEAVLPGAQSQTMSASFIDVQIEGHAGLAQSRGKLKAVLDGNAIVFIGVPD